jgi:hypothetical protein
VGIENSDRKQNKKCFEIYMVFTAVIIFHCIESTFKIEGYAVFVSLSLSYGQCCRSLNEQTLKECTLISIKRNWS